MRVIFNVFEESIAHSNFQFSFAFVFAFTFYFTFHSGKQRKQRPITENGDNGDNAYFLKIDYD